MIPDAVDVDQFMNLVAAAQELDPKLTSIQAELLVAARHGLAGDSRYVNPTTGGDVMSTIRCESHRLRAGISTAPRHEVGSTVFQVFNGRGTIVINGDERGIGCFAPRL
ncbi:hypothetical protein [Ensifer sp. MJa1]|uniref:hypothetical protein n=1 Tax=Ensifer sp. MJa1 TaxID=2919888 RepID=UPI00300884C0